MSRRLSLHLRHAPEQIGITLSEDGWVDVADLLAALRRHGLPLTREQLDELVATNDKQRFAYDEAGGRIRASQGHSVSVELDLPLMQPPDELFHGTVERSLAAILEFGLLPMKRHAVHLSTNLATATTAGARRGPPRVLRVDARAMADDGYGFRVSANGVWLTAKVPATYLSVVVNNVAGE